MEIVVIAVQLSRSMRNASARVKAFGRLPKQGYEEKYRTFLEISGKAM